MKTESPMSHIASQTTGTPKIPESQRVLWRAEIARRATSDADRADLLGMVLGEVA